MRVIYIANHNCGDNDDEGAVAYVLEALGHEVIKIHEKPRYRKNIDFRKLKGDFVLFHKWEDFESIKLIDLPKVFWFFDLVDTLDTDLGPRAAFRLDWIKKATAECVLGFCTDGDWVAQDETGKLHWLMQGADERVMGPGDPEKHKDLPPILFTGMINHGRSRARHVAALKEHFKDKFWILGEHGAKGRKHGRELADIMACVKVCVAPDGPQSDRYWSNRVFLTLGFGGCLVHPYCQGLLDFYRHRELLTYDNWDYCNDLIEILLESPTVCDMMRETGYKRTEEAHTYRHRVLEMLRIIKEVL